MMRETILKKATVFFRQDIEYETEAEKLEKISEIEEQASQDLNHIPVGDIARDSCEQCCLNHSSCVEDIGSLHIFPIISISLHVRGCHDGTVSCHRVRIAKRLALCQGFPTGNSRSNPECKFAVIDGLAKWCS